MVSVLKCHAMKTRDMEQSTYIIKLDPKWCKNR
jgi:hypothetical protein